MFTKKKTLSYGFYLKRDFEQHERIVAEYIWIDGSGIGIRSKARTLNEKPKLVEDIPEWNFDGSSTKQATTSDSEVILKPVNFYSDPFRGGDNILVLCATYRKDVGSGELYPTNTNFRHNSDKIFKTVE